MLPLWGSSTQMDAKYHTASLKPPQTIWRDKQEALEAKYQRHQKDALDTDPEVLICKEARRMLLGIRLLPFVHGLTVYSMWVWNRNLIN